MACQLRRRNPYSPECVTCRYVYLELLVCYVVGIINDKQCLGLTYNNMYDMIIIT